MIRTCPLAWIALAIALSFQISLAQDSIVVRPRIPVIDPGRIAEQKAIARKRAEEKRKAEAAMQDSVATPIPAIDDRGDYHGRGRDTGGAIILQRAGELRQLEQSSGEVVLLENNVKIIQDSLTIWCDRARHRRNNGLLELYGRVVMIDPQRRLDADEVFYYEDTRLSLARGHVVLERDSVILTCEQAQFDDNKDIANFDRDMVVRDLRRRLVLTGGYGTYWTERQFTRVPTDPVLVQLDSTGREEARVISEYMEYDADKGEALAQDSVAITWNDVHGWGRELRFDPDQRRGLLVGDPRVTHFRDEVVGDSIWLYMNEDTIDSAVVIGNAIAFTPSDSTGTAPRSSLKGRKIVLTFTDGDVSRMASFGQSVGIYHVFQDGVDQGSNEVSGDSVILNIEARELQTVLVVGGTEGTFYPPRLAGKLRHD